MEPDPRSKGWVPLNTRSTQPRTRWQRLSPEQIGDDGTWPMHSLSGPCRTWPVEPGCGCLPPDPLMWTDEQVHAVETATEILWRLTAGRFGLCREEVRPCRASCVPSGGGQPWTPVLYDGQWLNIPCRCRSADACSCSGEVEEIRLPGPVYWEPPESIRPPMDTSEPQETQYRYHMEVWIDGERLSSGGDPGYGRFWLFDRDRLIRTDGGSWPDCQHLDRPLTQPGTFGVIYWRGVPVPPGGRRAVALLACELWRACNGATDCRLPARVQTISREGVTYTVVDPQDFLNKGRTGMTEIDLWLSTVNPHGRMSPSGVWSPDMPRNRSEWTTGQLPPPMPGPTGW